MDVTYLSEALQDGLPIQDPNLGSGTLRHYALGELVLTSGKVLACDPFAYPNRVPFAVQVAPGKYPVIASVATFAKQHRDGMAYVILKLSNQAAVHWEGAAGEGQEVNELEGYGGWGYAVSSRTGCFMEAEIRQRLDQKTTTGGALSDQLSEAFAAIDPYNDIPFGGINFCVDEATGANIIAFTICRSKGQYISYCGYDADNQVTCLVTDFNLLAHPRLSQEDSDDASD